MTTSPSKTLAAKMLHLTMSMLRNNSEGLSLGEIERHIEHSVEFEPWALVATTHPKPRPKWKELLRHTLFDAKRGDFLKKLDTLWILTSEGEVALRLSPEDLIQTVLRKSFEARRATELTRNAFEALCALVGRETWCSNLGCTTCGASCYRYALVELANGKHPNAPNWIVRQEGQHQLSELGSPPRALTKEQQLALLELVSGIDVNRFVRSQRLDKAIECLHITFCFCRDSEPEGTTMLRGIREQLRNLVHAQGRTGATAAAECHIQGRHIFSEILDMLRVCRGLVQDQATAP